MIFMVLVVEDEDGKTTVEDRDWDSPSLMGGKGQRRQFNVEGFDRG